MVRLSEINFYFFSGSHIFVENSAGVEMNGVEYNFVRRINEKEERAFHELFMKFRSYLVLFAMRRVGQQEVAEDIVQEVFITVWESKKRYNSYHGFKAYLYDLVQNRCLNYLKHKRVENKYLSLAVREAEEDRDAYNLMQEEVYRELYIAIRELPDKCRSVFELHLAGKKNEEIAEALGISVLTVKSHKQNALHYLKKHMRNLFLLYLLLYKV